MLSHFSLQEHFLVLCTGRENQESQTLQISKLLCATLCRYGLNQILKLYVRTDIYDKEQNPSEKLDLWRKDWEKMKRNETERKGKEKAGKYHLFFYFSLQNPTGKCHLVSLSSNLCVREDCITRNWTISYTFL